jgi:hypothetical protein
MRKDQLESYIYVNLVTEIYIEAVNIDNFTVGQKNLFMEDNYVII